MRPEPVSGWPLLDDILPAWDFGETHSIRIHAGRDRVWPALHGVTPAETALLRALFAVRSLPARMSGGRGLRFSRQRPLLEQMSHSGFALLAEAEGRELVLGRIGRFWRLWDDDAVPFSGPAEFAAFAQPGYAKAALGIAVREAGEASVLTTETRVVATDPGAWRRFAAYWLAIRAGSRLVRGDWLRAVKRRAEATLTPRPPLPLVGEGEYPGGCR